MTFRNVLITAAITTKLALVGLFSQWLVTPADQEPDPLLAACPWCEGDPACEDSSCGECG